MIKTISLDIRNSKLNTADCWYVIGRMRIMWNELLTTQRNSSQLSAVSLQRSAISSQLTAISHQLQIMKDYRKIKVWDKSHILVDFRRFLQIAFGSANEVEYLIFLSYELSYLQRNQFIELDNKIKEVKRMLSGMIKTISLDIRNSKLKTANGWLLTADRWPLNSK